MNIKEAEKLSGVSSRNIRFYEQKGLLKPERNAENDYREYADEEIRTLKLIRALRMVDMPLEQIKRVVDGELPLQAAAADQKKKIKDKIKKLETAAYFCEELAKPEQDLDDVLMRMDVSDSRKELPKDWNHDYMRPIKEFLLPFLAGLLPAVWGYMLFWFLFIILYLPRPIALCGAMALPFVWAVLGYRSAAKKRWFNSFLFSHLIPLFIYIVWSQGSDLALFEQYAFPLEVLRSVIEGRNTITGDPSMYGLAVLAVCYCLGGLIGKLAAWISAKIAARQQTEADEARSSLLGRSKVFLWPVLIALPLIVALLLTVFGPLADSVKPETLEARLVGLEGSSKRVEVRTGPTNSTIYGVGCCAEFGDLFRFDEWERVYGSTYDSSQAVCKVALANRFMGGPTYYIELCSNGQAYVHCEREVGEEYAYFRIPQEVAEEVLAYAIKHDK